MLSCNRLCAVCERSVTVDTLDTLPLYECAHGHQTRLHKKCLPICLQCKPQNPIARGGVCCDPEQGRLIRLNAPISLDDSVFGDEDLPSKAPLDLHSYLHERTASKADIAAQQKIPCVWCGFPVLDKKLAVLCSIPLCDSAHPSSIGHLCLKRLHQCVTCYSQWFSNPIGRGSAKS